MTVDLSNLVKVKMEEEKLSLRRAGKQAGVAHTTIDRILKGESVDLSTMEKISRWVGIPVSDAIDLKNAKEGIQGEISTLIALHPEFGEVFSTLAKEITIGGLSTDILIEITGFTSYRLQKYREKKTG
jgi:transcriptional regulator with XRE-family HTH domain